MRYLCSVVNADNILCPRPGVALVRSICKCQHIDLSVHCQTCLDDLRADKLCCGYCQDHSDFHNCDLIVIDAEEFQDADR